MKFLTKTIVFLFVTLLMSSCVVTKQQYQALEATLAEKDKELENANKDLARYEANIKDYMNKLNACENDKVKLQGELNAANGKVTLREEQIADLKDQVDDYKKQRDKQIDQVGDLTDLSSKATDNIKETLSQLGKKDEYIQFLQLAKTRQDSINLALSANLKTVLQDGIADEDIEVKVDKTVVFINLSDKMLYKSGSSNLTDRANEVLGKIAKIVQSRPELEVMVEGYTDSIPIKTQCFDDNWDLSVKRATSVVRALQTKYAVDPNRLIAAGRGQYNALASNETKAGRAINRRTRIIILPRIDQFYDLLNPNNVPD